MLSVNWDRFSFLFLTICRSFHRLAWRLSVGRGACTVLACFPCSYVGGGGGCSVSPWGMTSPLGFPRVSSIRWSAPLPSWLNIFQVLSVFTCCLSLKSFQMTDVRIVWQGFFLFCFWVVIGFNLSPQYSSITHSELTLIPVCQNSAV